MIPIMALLLSMLSALASVRGLSVVPAAERTEVVIAVDGPVTVRDFSLADPARVVLDFSGAEHALPRERFTHVDRGGVLGLRVSQFQPEVVRVVVDLAVPVDYVVNRGAGEVRISFRNPDGTFDPWHSAPLAAMAIGGPTPPSTMPAPAPGRPAAARAQAQAQELPRITVYFQATPINDVLATFAEFSGMSIVSGAGITGSVTADIRDQPWDIALEAILQAQGLAAREMESGIIRVDNVGNLRQREAQEPLVTRQFKIDYINADSIRAAVEGLLSERGSVTVSTGTNSLVVTDGGSVFDRIAPMIEQLDVRTPQVTIAAKIIFVDRTALEELGIVYDLKDSRGNQINQVTSGLLDQDGDGVINPIVDQTDENVVLLGGNSIAALANANFRVPSPALQVVTSLMLGRHSLISFIDALESNNLTDIQAAPVVTTLDHREAYVQVGEETPIRVVDVGGAGGGGVPPRANVQMQETGVILRVTPHVTGDQVLLELHAERSNIALAPSDIGFTFQTQESETQILLNDGETGVISGLTIIQKDQVRAGIPFLMDLPLIGGLFRYTSEQENKQDLLIMVTPHIVREGGA